MPRTTSVTLGEHQQKYIASLINSGRYTSISEVIRDALRKMESAEIETRQTEKLDAPEKTPSKAWTEEAWLEHMRKKI